MLGNKYYVYNYRVFIESCKQYSITNHEYYTPILKVLAFNGWDKAGLTFWWLRF